MDALAGDVMNYRKERDVDQPDLQRLYDRDHRSG
jgi:hypothetical protein